MTTIRVIRYHHRAKSLVSERLSAQSFVLSAHLNQSRMDACLNVAHGRSTGTLERWVIGEARAAVDLFAECLESKF